MSELTPLSFVYGAALIIALIGMLLLDLRFRLFFGRDAGRAALVLVIGLLFFLAWDVAGIDLGIFFRGETDFMTGWQLAPELPVEELLFLALLCWLTMNVYGAVTSHPSPSVGRGSPFVGRGGSEPVGRGGSERSEHPSRDPRTPDDGSPR